MFNLLRNSQTVFQSSCTILLSFQLCMRVPVPPCSHQLLILLSLFNFSHSSWCAVVSHHEFRLQDLSGPEHSLMHSMNICWGFTKPQALCLCYAQLLMKARTILWHTQFCVSDWHLPITELMCDPMGHSPQDSSVRGILQARKLEWIAISSSRNCWTKGL